MGVLCAPSLAGVHHLKLPVTDPARSREWYHSRLGYELRAEMVEQGQLMGLALAHPNGGPVLALRLDPERHIVPGRHIGKGDERGDLDHRRRAEPVEQARGQLVGDVRGRGRHGLGVLQHVPLERGEARLGGLPLPPGLTGLVGDLLNDPPGFDRTVLPDIDRKIVEFFRKHLLPVK